MLNIFINMAIHDVLMSEKSRSEEERRQNYDWDWYNRATSDNSDVAKAAFAERWDEIKAGILSDSYMDDKKKSILISKLKRKFLLK